MKLFRRLVFVKANTTSEIVREFTKYRNEHSVLLIICM